MKNKIIISILFTFIVFLLVGCVNNKNEDYMIKEYDLKEIIYEQTILNQKVNENEILFSLKPITEHEVGDEVYADAILSAKLSSDNPYYYIVIDWGDGTWAYRGPYISSTETQSNPRLYHRYYQEGTYSVKALAIELTTGKTHGWSESLEYVITGNKLKKEFINQVKPIASSKDKTNGNLEHILDNNNETFFKTAEAQDYDEPQYVGLIFDDFYRLSDLEIKFPNTEETFPSNIAIEYTTDGGKVWQSLPKYYYLYDYSIGRYNPIMRFPNPMGATLSLSLDGIVANGIRITAKMFLNEPRTLSVSEMRVVGDKELLFYSSNGGTFDANINNMWTIFGSAETEPVVAGSLGGEKTNQSPFRTGSAMIASTEWTEWTGLQFNWMKDSEVKDIYLNQLINVRFGPDGWSDDDGYIYATSDQPKHLGSQNHYSLNPTFILAVRNYLLQSNNLNVMQDGVVVNFMDAKNSHGQTMSTKIEKAMSYMLNTLEGKNGILTINDPDNDGTQKGTSSNYWDAHKSFGYKSAYENALFYASLLAMADIKLYLGNQSEAEYYLNLAEKAKEEYNNLFWDSVKGRYITSVNKKGERMDFGITFVNFYAIKYGLASETQAQIIYDWLDGKRIIEGEASTGKDIYGAFIYAPRSNTVDVSSTGAPYYWWDHNGALPPTEGTFGGFDHQMQNGGTIFYISYYDIMSRLQGYGTNDAYNRFYTIMTEFHKDSLRRNAYKTFIQNGVQGIGEYREGVMGEFPESGLVPLTFLTAFIGINTTAQGLKIDANLPSNMSFAGIREYHYGNRVYSIQVSKEIDSPTIEYDGSKYFVKVPANNVYLITIDNKLIKVDSDD